MLAFLPSLRRLVAVCALVACAFLVVLTSSPAEARSRHRGHHAHSHSHFSHHHHHARRHHHGRRHHSYRGHRAHRHASRHRHAHVRRLQESYAALAPQQTVRAPDIAPQIGSAVTNVVAEARRYIGGNPTGRRSLWCARFMNMVLQRSGHRTTGSDMARSFASYGRHLPGPQVGAIAVMSRGRGGGHVGIVSGIDPKGNPIVVSGNHGHRVAEFDVFSRARLRLCDAELRSPVRPQR